MNGAAVNELWHKALTEQRTGAAQRANADIDDGRAFHEQATAWLRRTLPECCDERGVPHVRFVGAVEILHYALGPGEVRRDAVRDRVRQLYPDAYADVYGAVA